MYDKEKAVQGVGVYAEFARSNATTQIIITPDGYDNAGRLIGLGIIRRTITSETPKKPWKFSILPTVADHAVVTDDEKDAFCGRRMAIPAALFDQVMNGGWSMVGTPILLEVSKKDFDDIGTKKQPSKLIYRINQSRIAQGFPTDLINA